MNPAVGQQPERSVAARRRRFELDPMIARDALESAAAAGVEVNSVIFRTISVTSVPW